MGGDDNPNLCTGYLECKQRIDRLEFRVELMEREKVDQSTIHQLNLEIQRILGSLEEVKNNRKEDREQISKINESISRLESMINVYIEKMTEAVIGAESVKELMVDYKAVLDRWQEAENAKFINIYKKWANKTKFTKALSYVFNLITLSLIVTLVFSIYVDAINGSANTSTWDMFIEIIRAIRGV